MSAEQSQRLGRYRVQQYGGETVRAFIPPPLPPVPAIDFSRLQRLLDQANQAVGRLDGVSWVLPEVSLFLYAYVRKEAVLSSQIEGTQSSLSDLLLFENDEAPGVPFDDVHEVSNYVRALQYGLERLRGGFPLSLRLLREIHAILLSGGRGAEKEPGEFRRSQNWIGGTRPGNALFVPPPPDELTPCLSAFELFLHAEDSALPLLVKTGLAHVQFETIHPFLDGNGRLGRLLITLMLCEAAVLREPTLYLSLYLKQHRSTYYELLNAVRSSGDWESWLDFFLSGVKITAEQAATSARRILELFEADRRRVESLGRSAASTLRVFEHLKRMPLITIPRAASEIGISAPTVAKSLSLLEGLKIVRELTGRERGRVFVYDNYLKILNEGMEPLE